MESPQVVQPLDSFPTFYGTRRFITAFASALHLYLSWDRPFQSPPLHSISRRTILMLFIHLRLGLPSSPFSSGSSTNNLYADAFSSRYMSHAPRIYNSNYTGWRVQITQLLDLQLSRPSRHFIPLQSKYSPQHPVLKHTQSVFLP
jgi:hypothetical protein